MATQRTLDKLADLTSVTDLTNAELKFVLNNWDDASRKLQANVVRTFKDLPKIPAALQCLFIEMDERAAKAIGELLCGEAQELILSDKDFADDVPVLVAKCVQFKSISEALWKRLAMMHKKGELKALITKKLIARKDAHPNFLKIAGVSATTAVKAQRKVEVAEAPKRRVRAEPEVAPKRTTPKPKSGAVSALRAVFKPIKPSKANTVKNNGDDDFEEDDFTDEKRVGKAVRRVRRPLV